MGLARCREVLEHHFKIDRCEIEGSPEGPETLKEWAMAWRLVGLIDLGEYCKLCDLIEAHFG